MSLAEIPGISGIRLKNRKGGEVMMAYKSHTRDPTERS